MDVAWPFKRNVYMVVPKAEADQVMQHIDGVSKGAIHSHRADEHDVTRLPLDNRTTSFARAALDSQAV